MRIYVYDAKRQEWRDFIVMPPDSTYVAVCGNGLHQCYASASRCGCGTVSR
jgi:hypothetical protein